ncbi:DoxX family protein [Parasphingopyxis marina]|uniref:DoxX family protein n=1 Tax=Parasphingopyxis marina TaxID=2761622 RepID=A0A842I196_9SPHN|nr:DoxX family protein [Parasphingopyxis marina]MBC2778915.1 DoxX family protein [Parasphingopyxis marina]
MRQARSGGDPYGLPPLFLFGARLLLAAQFLAFGALKIRNSTTMHSYIESFGLPGELVWPAAIFQLVAGLMIVLGFCTRLAALALAGFCLLATGIFHWDLGDLGELAFFFKDLGAAGGFLLLYHCGPGGWSFDARRG